MHWLIELWRKMGNIHCVRRRLLLSEGLRTDRLVALFVRFLLWRHEYGLLQQIHIVSLARPLLPLLCLGIFSRREWYGQHIDWVFVNVRNASLQSTSSSQHIDNLFIRANVLELYGSSLHHVTDVMVSDLYVFRLVMKYKILCHFYAALVVT